MSEATHRPSPPRRPKPYDPEEDEDRRRRHAKAVEDQIRDYWRRYRDHYRHETPWLVIRYGPGDVGLRPVPSNVAVYLSPDIWVESSDPGGNAVAGEQNHVWVRVFNLGKHIAFPVKLDYYWANPALGLGAAQMNLIGTEWIEIPSQWSSATRCSTPWVPVFVNGGHECLKVNCSCPTFDPITVPFDPQQDRHVGQRNITVLHGQAGAALELKLELNNLLPFAVKAEIFGQALHVAARKRDRPGIGAETVTRLAAIGNRVITPAEVEARAAPGSREALAARQARRWGASTEPGADLAGFRLLDSAPAMRAVISEERTRFHPSASQVAFARSLLTGSRLAFDDTSPRSQMHQLDAIGLEPHESRQLHLQLHVPPAARPGEHIVFTFEQWAGGLHMGGYAAVVEVVERRRE